ncbi:MAG: hypothetical protein V3U50_01525 [Acidimicrobiia bacterium]
MTQATGVSVRTLTVPALLILLDACCPPETLLTHFILDSSHPMLADHVANAVGSDIYGEIQLDPTK